MKPIKTSIPKIGLLTVKLFGLMEIFIFFGIQFFWIIYKGDLLPTENTWDLLAVLFPFLIAYIVGIFCRIEKYRSLFRKMEWLIHLLISISFLIFLIVLQTRDEFNPYIPFTWLFYFYFIIIGLILISAIIMNLDKPSLITNLKDKRKFSVFMGIFAVSWLATLGIISISQYPVYFSIFSSIFHSIMVPLSIINHGKHPETHDSRVVYRNFKQMILRKTDETQIEKKKSVPKLLSRNLSLFFLFVLIVFSIIMQWDPNMTTGAPEDNYYLIIGPFFSPLFYLGFGIALLNSKFRFPIIGDGIILPFIALSIMGICSFAPLTLGYAIMRLFLQGSNQTSSSYVSTIVGVTLSWTLGLYLFAYYGYLDYIAFFLGTISLGNLINLIIVLILTFIFCINLGLFSIEKYVSKRKKEKKSMNNKKGSFEGLKKLREATKKSMTKESLPRKELQVKKSGVVILAIILGGLISPFIILNLTEKGPPLVFPEKERYELEDFCGAGCAGYTGEEWEYNNLTKLGVRWTNTGFPWRDIEWSNDNYNYSGFDDYVANCTKYNIKIIANLNHPPSWLNLSTTEYVPPKYIDHYLEFVNKTIRRYNDTVAAWDIWNEPDQKRFWDGPIEHYYYLFGRVVNLIHDIDPDLYIMGPSLASAGSPYFPPHLEEMFKLGIMKHVDAISFHFYTFDPDTLYQGIKQYVTLGNKYGFKGDYVITEMGNPTGGTYPGAVSMEKLAENVIKRMVISSALQIKTVIWYCTRDWAEEEIPAFLPDSEYWYGLCYSNYTWKKGAHAFSLFSKFCSNSTYCPDLIIKKRGISATDLMASLYRQEDGTSTLIMWYAPTLYESGTVRVNLDLSAVGGSVFMHDIYTGTNRTLDENYVIVGDAPVFLTFQPSGINDPITLQVQESILAVALYISMIGIFIASISLAVVIRKRDISYKNE
ncbi:MAG: hypothetical protein CEE42_08190 [Promethearchaeota archaeon Loki_b31]|nr:MAG: hypothetical protein CEE42_08190 [Candidatus Lokiarchaeota archaeon Loki_b31]